MKLAVIGFGAATIGLLRALHNSAHEIHIFEQAVDIYSSSVSGIRADGKLFVSSGMGGELELSLEQQQEVVEYYLSKANVERSRIEYGNSFGNKGSFKKFYERGFEPVLSEYWHIGTDELKNVLSNIYAEFLEFSNVHFHFSSQIRDISEKEDKIFLNGSQEGFDRLIIAAGRTGHKLVNNLIPRHPHLVLENTKVDLGIRFELPNHIVEHLNKEMYEFKIRLRTETGYTVRTFCNNPAGFVVLEKYDDFVTVNGHSKLQDKSDNTNFALLVSHTFTEPFNNPVGYGSYIAKLANILAGGEKAILQTYGDFKRTKRSKHLGRVKPTLSSDNYILGDLNLAIPGKTRQALTEFIETLDEIVPGVAYSDNLMYGMEIKFYSNKLSNEHPLIKFIGDCSGWTRSITYATGHGMQLGKELLEEK
ncbi:MAG: NAD(P)/FAD-dependent oxidoreductase [Candidatus Cloacimonetes bacterium]|nr:NAD(P)/FAD-dependent oxidoreductase [Candidatus Cloacimonadota bacterium]